LGPRRRLSGREISVCDVLIDRIIYTREEIGWESRRLTGRVAIAICSRRGQR